MRSDMFSPTKHEDTRFLIELISLIELLVKVDTKESLDLAERFGEYYLELKQKTETHDYTKDDERLYQILEITT